MRVRAEIIARANASGPDVRLDEIYAQMVNMVREGDLARLLHHECEAEIALTIATRRGKVLWEEAFERGCRVAVATDMYLPKAVLSQILARCGYGGWTALYASGDDGIAKFNGSAFDKMSADFPGIRVTHVGDNPTSDVDAARSRGIKSLLVRRPLDLRSEQSTGLPSFALGRDRREAIGLKIGTSISVAIVEAWLDRDPGPISHSDEVGYSVLGPALVGFCQYLDAEARSYGISRLVFLAREGRLLRDAYNAYLGESALANEYAVLSTRMLGLGALVDPLSEASVHFLTKTSTPLRPLDFMRRVLPDLPEDRIRESCERLGIPWRTRFSQKSARAELLPLFEEFSAELAQVGVDSGPVVSEYLGSLETSRRGTAIVDVGWAGSIQNTLNELTESTHTGIYLGLCDSPRTRSLPNLHGWIDERQGGEISRTFRRLYRRVPALEVLLANTESGSASLVRAGDPDSGSRFELEYLANEFTEEHRVQIQRIQTRALEYVKDYRSHVAEIPAPLNALPFADSFGPVFEFLTRPSSAQVRTLADLEFDGSYGVNSMTLGQWWIPEAVHRR